MEVDNCPNCGISYQGDPIPQEYIDEGYYGNSTHYSNNLLIGHEIRGVYDGVLYWHCNACGTDFHRDWGNYSDEMQKKAEVFMNKGEWILNEDYSEGELSG